MAVIRPFRASFPSLDKVSDIQDFFNQAKFLFPEYVARGIYDYQEKGAFYIYEQTIEDQNFTGVIALASLQDYEEGDIVRHEHTLKEKEEKMLRLIDERQATIKPAVLAYQEVKEITKLLTKLKRKDDPIVSLCYLGAMHRVWAVTKPKLVKELGELFRHKVPKTYIGDGHHRFATASILHKKFRTENPNHTGTEDYNFLLCALFASNQLRIQEFNRVVQTLNNYNPKGVKAELRKDFIITKCYTPVVPNSKYEIGMYLSHKWYSLMPKKHLLENKTQLSDLLSVSIWNRYVLGKILGINDVRTDNRVKYVEGPKGIEALQKKVGKNAFAVGFTFYPVALDDLMAISDAGEVMPPKSTWFTPRMTNGIIVHLFNQ